MRLVNGSQTFIGWSVCDSLMNVRILLFLIKKFNLFMDDEMKSQYKQKSQLQKCFSHTKQFLSASGCRWWTLKSQMSKYSFMLKTLCALSLFIRNPGGYEREYQFFPWQYYRSNAPRVLWFIFCIFSILKRTGMSNSYQTDDCQFHFSFFRLHLKSCAATQLNIQTFWRPFCCIRVAHFDYPK